MGHLGAYSPLIPLCAFGLWLLYIGQDSRTYTAPCQPKLASAPAQTAGQGEAASQKLVPAAIRHRPSSTASRQHAPAIQSQYYPERCWQAKEQAGSTSTVCCRFWSSAVCCDGSTVDIQSRYPGLMDDYIISGREPYCRTARAEALEQCRQTIQAYNEQHQGEGGTCRSLVRLAVSDWTTLTWTSRPYQSRQFQARRRSVDGDPGDAAAPGRQSIFRYRRANCGSYTGHGPHLAPTSRTRSDSIGGPSQSIWFNSGTSPVNSRTELNPGQRIRSLFNGPVFRDQFQRRPSHGRVWDLRTLNYSADFYRVALGEAQILVDGDPHEQEPSARDTDTDNSVACTSNRPHPRRNSEDSEHNVNRGGARVTTSRAFYEPASGFGCWMVPVLATIGLFCSGQWYGADRRIVFRRGSRGHPTKAGSRRRRRRGFSGGRAYMAGPPNGSARKNRAAHATYVSRPQPDPPGSTPDPIRITKGTAGGHTSSSHNRRRPVRPLQLCSSHHAGMAVSGHPHRTRRAFQGIFSWGSFFCTRSTRTPFAPLPLYGRGFHRSANQRGTHPGGISARCFAWIRVIAAQVAGWARQCNSVFHKLVPSSPKPPRARGLPIMPCSLLLWPLLVEQ